MSKITQARAAVIKTIQDDPTVITVVRKALMNDGFNSLIDDSGGASREYKFRVRISHERSVVAKVETSPIGGVINPRLMITVDYRGGPLEGDAFTMPRLRKSIQMVSAKYSENQIMYNSEPVAIDLDLSFSESYIIGRMDELTEDGVVVGYQAPMIKAGS